MSEMTEKQTAWLLYSYAAVLTTIAFALLVGGGQLVLLNGSPYYLASGLVLLVAAMLLFRRRAAGATVFGLFMLATVTWAIWEVGFDAWQLMPRLAAPAAFSIGFLFPAIRRPLSGLSAWPNGKAILRGAGAFASAAVIGGVIHAAAGPIQPENPIYRNGIATAAAPLVDRSLDGRDWPTFAGTEGGSRFTPLDQVTPANIDKLEIAWIYRTGPDPKGNVATMEAAPIKIGDTVYSCTDFRDVFALDPDTGKEKWRFRSGNDMTQAHYTHCRGVGYYAVPGAGGLCATRIYVTTIDGRLVALDGATGALCPDFGNNGAADLFEGMGADVDGSYYNHTSAPTVAGGKVLIGGMVADGQYWGEPSGVIRAFDAVTGKLAWAWDMGRPDRTGLPPEGETYTRSTPNSWAGMSVDSALGLVYVPTGNASGADYYGAQRRPFDDKYSSSVVALDIATGRPRWHFQTIHHDLWDYDVSSQPVLVDVPRTDGAIEKGLIQPTKRGEMFYLDRATGKPLAQVEERPVPTRDSAPGERISPTQPFSVGMPSVSGPNLTERAMWGITPLDQLWCRLDFRQRRYDGPLTPPGLTPSINYPGYTGGSNWGSVAIDRDRQIMIAKSNHFPIKIRLMPRREAEAMNLHRMAPGVKVDMAGDHAQEETPYAAEISQMLSPLKVPCLAPPMGTISAIDLRTRKVLWTKPLGTSENSGPMGIKSRLPLPFGALSLGGALTTRSGLTFVGGTNDGYLRALDTATGKEVWRKRLPAASYASPVSYSSAKSGRQFIVLSAGGYPRMGAPAGDYVIALALSDGSTRNKK